MTQKVRSSEFENHRRTWGIGFQNKGGGIPTGGIDFIWEYHTPLHTMLLLKPHLGEGLDTSKFLYQVSKNVGR